MKQVLIIGAKSDMAKATASLYAQKGYELLLAARNVNELQPFASDLKIKEEKEATLIELDLLDYKSHKPFYTSLEQQPDLVICFVGYLGEQEVAEKNFDQAKLITDTNYTGVMSILNIIANDFEVKKKGTIVCVSSVAGERGRKSNYLYGAAKAALSTYLSGLRNRLFSAGVHVLTVKPGFVDTEMTKDLELPGLLTAKPEEVANDIYKAEQKKKNTLYTKWMWKWIMLIIRNIPEGIFKKMNL